MATTTQQIQSGKQLLNGLDFLWLEITNSCNLNCGHCYTKSGPDVPLFGTMQEQDWVTLLEDASENGCQMVQFIGGEPTMHPSLPTLIAQADSIGYNLIEVFSNGTKLSEPVFQAYLDHKVHVAFSVYGPNAQIHDEVTRRPGSFERTVKTIRRVVDAGLSTRVGIIGMESNKSYIDETEAFVRSLGVAHVGSGYVRGIGRGENHVAVQDPLDELCGHCWDGKLVVTPNGDAFPCAMARAYPVGNVSDGLVQVLDDLRLRKFREQMKSEQTMRMECGPDPGPCRPDCIPRQGYDPGGAHWEYQKLPSSLPLVQLK